MLPAHVAGSRSMLAAVQRDFARLRALDHPNIARLLELGCNGQQYYVTGERLDGEPLREVLSHLLPERPEADEADDIVRAIGSALVYAHENDVAHGDVRAENVIVTMDRRYVLTNFMARRVAKMASRAPRPSDDLKGLARLAAELYTGSISARALRGAAHGDVPAARLNAIRSVLEPASKRPSSVSQFLAAAGLAYPAPAAAAPAPRAVAQRKPQRSWSLWRFVVPVAAVAALGVGAAYYGGVGVAAEELKVRGLDAWRAVAARVAPPAGEAAHESIDPALAQPEAPPPAVAAEPAGIPESQPIPEPEPLDDPPAEAQPAATAPSPPIASAAADPVVAAAEPPAVSLGVPRIAAREDHAVVAIDVVRSGDTSHEAAVSWWTTPDTAHVDEDYAGIGRQTLTFAAGAAVERVVIPLVNDGVRESDEAFTVHLGRPRGGVAGALTATRVTLHDDD